jgi:hypothetical protein
MAQSVVCVGVVLLDQRTRTVTPEEVDGGIPLGKVVSLMCLDFDEVEVILIE